MWCFTDCQFQRWSSRGYSDTVLLNFSQLDPSGHISFVTRKMSCSFLLVRASSHTPFLSPQRPPSPLPIIPWWLVMLSDFSYTVVIMYVCLWKNVCLFMAFELVCGPYILPTVFSFFPGRKQNVMGKLPGFRDKQTWIENLTVLFISNSWDDTWKWRRNWLNGDGERPQ